MTSKHRSLSVSARIGLSIAAGFAGSLLMAGCGLGTSPVSTGAISAASFGGKINGGPNPIVGATIKAYTTGDAYGTGVFAQEANQQGASAGQDTAADGSFTFAGGYACPAGHYLYIVSSGGNTGSLAANPKAFLVAAIGRCDDLFSGGTFTGGYVYINEASTVAAAYALGGFSAQTGTDVNAVIGIGAPPANNAAVGCVAGTGSCTTTAAAGLRHAFQTANNLVSPFSTSTNARLAGGGRVPLQLVNSIANTVVACVNSDGTANACKTLFSATCPPGTTTSGCTDYYTHGNTYQALVNLAANPTLHGTATTSGQFLAAATPQTSFYQPFLTSPPPDYSIAILYQKFTGAGATNGITYPNSGTLDINDNYLVGNYDSATPTMVNAISFNTSGLVSITTPNTVDLDGNGASADALGNLYLVGTSPSLPAASITDYAVDTPSGTISTAQQFYVGNAQLISSAVDRKNNLWFGSQNNPSIAQLNSFPRVVNYTRGLLAPATAIALDPNQNVWVTTGSGDAANAVGVVQNLGSAGAPSYSNANYLNASVPSLNVSGVSFATNANVNRPYVAYASNTTNPGFTKATPLVVGSEVTTVAIGSHVTGSPALNSAVNNQSDGAGTVWAGGGINIVKYQPTGSLVVLNPCSFSTTTNNTSCNVGAYNAIQSVSIDASGSVWFSDAQSGTVSQLVGAAAPTWPLVSLGILTVPQ